MKRWMIGMAVVRPVAIRLISLPTPTRAFVLLLACRPSLGELMEHLRRMATSWCGLVNMMHMPSTRRSLADLRMMTWTAGGGHGEAVLTGSISRISALGEERTPSSLHDVPNDAVLRSTSLLALTVEAIVTLGSMLLANWAGRRQFEGGLTVLSSRLGRRHAEAPVATPPCSKFVGSGHCLGRTSMRAMSSGLASLPSWPLATPSYKGPSMTTQRGWRRKHAAFLGPPP